MHSVSSRVQRPQKNGGNVQAGHGPARVAQQRDVAQRRLAIHLIALGNVSHGPERAAVDVLGIQPQRSIPAPRDALRGIQTDEVAPGELIEDAPHFPRSVTGAPCAGRSCKWRTRQPRRRADRTSHSGHRALPRPTAETVQRPSWYSEPRSWRPDASAHLAFFIMPYRPVSIPAVKPDRDHTN
jgi:hypothetical protein